MSATRAERALSHEEQLLIETSHKTIKDRVLALSGEQPVEQVGIQVNIDIDAYRGDRKFLGFMSFDPSSDASTYSFRFITGNDDETLQYIFSPTSVRKGGVVGIDIHSTFRTPSWRHYSDEPVTDAKPDTLTLPALDVGLEELRDISAIISDPFKNIGLVYKLPRLPSPTRLPV